MRFFGPISSLFDGVTFLFLFFIFCPDLFGHSFFALTTSEQAHFIALFQTGWFLESMWSQVLILHSLRTEKLPWLESKPANAVSLVTLLGIGCFTLLTFTPLGHVIGLMTLPPVYFIFLIIIISLYLFLVNLAKKYYLKKYHTLF